MRKEQIAATAIINDIAAMGYAKAWHSRKVALKIANMRSDVLGALGDVLNVFSVRALEREKGYFDV